MAAGFSGPAARAGTTGSEVNPTFQLTSHTAIALVMNHNHRFRTFAENGFGYVGMCAGCRTINVAFQNSLFCLTLDQFDTFVEMMQNRLAMRPINTTHGKELMLPTPMPNYFLLFSDDDLASLCALLNEAAPILEAERILDLSQRLN
ncbi:MAG: hypothetical protein EOO39_13540 [Cytophagaceae bacterium]|nr:MAG: hypothetical protein EOO39_13540 [Cytophagaceae bacterium]